FGGAARFFAAGGVDRGRGGRDGRAAAPFGAGRLGGGGRGLGLGSNGLGTGRLGGLGGGRGSSFDFSLHSRFRRGLFGLALGGGFGRGRRGRLGRGVGRVGPRARWRVSARRGHGRGVRAAR